MSHHGRTCSNIQKRVPYTIERRMKKILSRSKDKVLSVGENTYDMAYVDVQCRTLLDKQFFSHADASDMQGMLKYMKQRHLQHGLFDYSGGYKAAVTIPTMPPVYVSATAKSPSLAVALLGVVMAELAGI